MNSYACASPSPKSLATRAELATVLDRVCVCAQAGQSRHHGLRREHFQRTAVRRVLAA